MEDNSVLRNTFYGDMVRNLPWFEVVCLQ